MAGIVAICNYKEKANNNTNETFFYLIHALRMLQHRGKAYWKITLGDDSLESKGPLPSNKQFINILKKNGICGSLGLGYLSKRSPLYQSMNSLNVAFDGFFVDTEKLFLHPRIGTARNFDHLYQIYYIFVDLLHHKDPESAAEFLDRHLRGNFIVKIGSNIYIYKNSTGFKPLIIAQHDNIVIVSSENSLKTTLSQFELNDVQPGELLKINSRDGLEKLTKLESNKIMLDPFEFIRDSHVTSNFNDKSIYSIRKNIGKIQSNYLSNDLEIDSVFAEPDYTRPMALGFSLTYKKINPTFEISEGVIKDRYDDFDDMIDFSEQESRNKLLTTTKSLKFIIENLVVTKRIVTLQGTLQTGATIKETLYYLKKAGAKDVIIVVSYVPTIDGRQVGLYTYNKDFIANKYVGKVSSINELNRYVAKELGTTALFYNSPNLLSKGIGIAEKNLWFPEWVRFLDYNK